MPTTLKVKNEHNADVNVVIDSKTKATIPNGRTADLDQLFLTSKGFETLFAEGKLSLVADPNPSPEQITLARRVVPNLLARIGGRHVNLHSHMKQRKDTLAKLRDEYNRNWSSVETVLKEAKSAGPLAERLNNTAKEFVNVKPEEDAVKKIELEIADIDAKDPKADGFNLQDWYEEREKKVAELEAAKRKLETAKLEVIGPVKNLLPRLDTAAADLKAVDPAKDIGAKIANW